MKFKYFTLILTIAISGKSYSQIGSGNKIINASLLYSSVSKEDNLSLTYSKNTNISSVMGAGIGYFVRDKISMGLDIGYAYLKSEDEEGSTRINSDISGVILGVSSRLYTPLVGQLQFFINPKFSTTNMTGTSRMVSSFDQNVLKSQLIYNNLGVGAGLTFLVNKHWGLDVYLPDVLLYSYTYSNLSGMNSYDNVTETKVEFKVLPGGADKWAFGLSYFF